jgi:TP901 family phage tail tape measure protein
VARKNNIDVVVKGDYQDKDINRAINDLKKLQASSMSLGGKMKAVGGQVQKFGDSMARTGKTLTAGLTLPIVGLGAAAVKGFADFDAALTQSAAIMGNVSEEVRDRMSKAARDVATSLNISHKQAAESFYFLASAGLDAEQSIAALPQVATFAKAGMFDMATATDLATDAQSALGLTSDDAGQNLANLTRVTDVFVKANTLANASVEQFSTSITTKAGVALRNAGKDIEEGTAVLAVFADQGIKGEQAGTMLTRTLEGLQDNARKNANQFAAFNVQVFDSEGAMRPMVDIVQDLEGAMAGMSVEEQNATIAKLGFNKLAKQGILALLGNSDALAEYDAGLRTAGGTAQEVAQKQLETFNEKLGLLRQQFADIAIEFGPIVIDQFLTPLGDRLRDIAARISELTPQQREMIVRFAGIAAAIGPVLLIVGKLVSVAGGLIKIFGGITIAGSILAIKVVAVVAAIAGIVIAFKKMYDNSESLRTAVGRLIDTAKNIARVLWNDLLGAFTSVTGVAGDAGSIFDRVAEVAGNILAGAINVLVGWWNILANGVRAAIKVFEIAFTIVRMVATLIRGAFVAAIDVLMNKLGPVSTALRSLAEGIRSAFTQAVSIVRNAISNGGKFLADFINKGIGIVNKMIDAYNALEGIIPGVTAVTNIATFTFRDMTASVERAAYSANNLANDVGGYASQVMRGNTATEAGVATFSNFTTAADDLSEALAGSGGTGAGGTAAASDKASERMEAFKAKFNEVADSLKAKTKEIQDAYDGVISSVQGVVMGAFDVSNIDPNRVGENGEAVGGTWLDGLASQAEKAVNFANKVAEVVKLGLEPGSPAFETVMGVTKQQGEGLLDELIAGGVDAVQRSVDIVNSVTGAAVRVGTEAADQFYGTGLALAQKTEAAFSKRFGEGGPGYGKLNRMMSALAKSMERTTKITVITEHVSTGIPGRRFGGPVAAGSPYIVGEAGPELFVPTVPGRIVPNHDITGSMTGQPRGAVMGGGGGSVINLTVNAGIGTQGAEVGRQIVDALKAYERRNGAVYVSA